MKNQIIIPLNICKRLDEISSYNHNYYCLPEGMFIYGCNVIYEICNEDYDSYDYVLGKYAEGKFNDDENHERFPSSYGFEYLKDRIVIEIDRKGEYNT